MDVRTPDPANPLPRATQTHNALEKTKRGIFERGVITLPDDVMRRFVELADGSDRLAKALSEATKRCKNVVKLG